MELILFLDSVNRFNFLQKEIIKLSENYKKVVEEEKKGEDNKGEKKYFDLEFKGTQTEPSGMSFEIYNISYDLYDKFVDKSQKYMQNALFVFTISINIHDNYENYGVNMLEEFKKLMEPLKNENEIF